MRKLKALLVGLLAVGTLATGVAGAHVSQSNMSTQFTSVVHDSTAGTLSVTAKGTLSNPGDSHAQVILDMDVQQQNENGGSWNNVLPHGHKVINDAGPTVSITKDIGMFCNEGPLQQQDYIRIKLRARTYGPNGTLTGDQTINQSQRQVQCDIVGPFA